MSFTCQFCGEAQPQGTKPEKVITKARVTGAKAIIINPITAQYIESWQIVEEKLACPACAKISRKPEMVG